MTTKRRTVRKRAMAWVVGNDTGSSSRAIWAHMMGAGMPSTWGWSYPSDPADLGRCLRLLEMIPEWRKRLPEMARRSPRWKKLVKNWDRLATLMAEEVGIDWSKGCSAPNTFKAMKKIGL